MKKMDRLSALGWDDASGAQASLHYLLAMKQAPLSALLRSCGSMVRPAVELPRPAPIAVGRSSVPAAFASMRHFPRPQQQLEVDFFDGFCTPPACPCSRQVAGKTRSWQLRVAAQLGPALDNAFSLRSTRHQKRVRLTKQPAKMQLPAASSLMEGMHMQAHGYIGRDDLATHLTSLGLPCDDAYVGELLCQYHSAQDAQAFSQGGFEQYTQRVSAHVLRAYQSLDRERNGSITADKLLTALHQLGCSAASSSDAVRMVQLLDRTDSHSVSLQDFARFACLLPKAQLRNRNVAFCWSDCADAAAGMEPRLSMTPSKQTRQRLLAGGVAGALSRSMVAPLERLRTIMMASPVPLTMREAVQAVWHDGHVSGLFKGNMATVVKVLPASAVQFAVYDSVSDALRAARGGAQQPDTPVARGAELADKLAAGVLAGAASCVATYPLETVRTMMCVPGAAAAGSFVAATQEAVRRYGVKGLYAGFKSSLLCEMLGTGLGFAAYEAGQAVWQKSHGRKPCALEKGLVGACSALVVMTATMPLELIQRRMQVQVAAAMAASNFAYRGPLHALSHICRTEGFAAFYRGSLFAYAKVVPSIGAMYMLYELCSQCLAIDGLRRYSRPYLAAQKSAADALQPQGALAHQQAAAAAQETPPHAAKCSAGELSVQDSTLLLRSSSLFSHAEAPVSEQLSAL